METISTEQFFEELGTITKEFDFAPVKELIGRLPEADRKIFENTSDLPGVFSQNYNAQKMIGKQPKFQPIPDPKTEEGMSKLRELMGVAKTPDEINLGTEANDLDPVIQKQIKDAFVKSGFTPQQAKDAFDTFLNITKEDSAADKAAKEAKATELHEAKVLKFGEKLEEMNNLAEDYINKQPEALRNQLKELAKTADGLDYIANQSKIQAGDNPAGPEGAKPATTKTAAEQIKDILSGKDLRFRAELYGTPYPDKGGKPSREAQAAAKERWTLLNEKATKGL